MQARRCGAYRGPMSSPAPVPLERLAAELRAASQVKDELMRSAGTEPTLPETVSAVMDRYDGLLLDAAAMLDVEVPPEARSAVDPRVLTHQGRVDLEEGLAAAGLDVRPT